MELQISDALGILGAALTLFGLWYKINQDTDTKIGQLRKESDEDITKIRGDFEAMRNTAISRREHDTDIENVKQEIRTFRDEVREDIRALNVSLTSRFDMMMQRMMDVGGNNPSHRSNGTKP